MNIKNTKINTISASAILTVILIISAFTMSGPTFSDNVSSIQQANAKAIKNEASTYFYANQPDYNKSFKLYSQAVEQDERIAICNFGLSYFGGFGVKEDQEKGIQTLKQGAEDLNIADCQYYLSIIYFFDMADKPINGYTKQLISRPYLNRSSFFSQLINKDKNTNHELSIQWAERAAAQNHIYALYFLGQMYSEQASIAGKDAPEYAAKAVEYCKQSFDLGFAKAGLCMFVSYSALDDIKNAAYWLQKGAEAGDPEAQEGLARFYSAEDNQKGEFSKYFKYDEKKAIYWLEKARQQGYYSIFTAP